MTEHASLARFLGAARQPAQRLCVGIDPHPQTLSAWGLPDSAQGAATLGATVVEACLSAGVTLLKPQVALFERFGVAGLATLHSLMADARRQGMLVIADAKRGDIGSTMAGYASAWLEPGSDFESDGLTVSPFLGVGALEPAFELAVTQEKTVFVLAATSNPEAVTLQTAIQTDGDTVSQGILHQLIDRVNSASAAPGWLGAVVGATLRLDDHGIDLSHAKLPLLAPGFGYQGASLSSLRDAFGEASDHVIPTVSRSVAGESMEGLPARLDAHLQELHRV